METTEQKINKLPPEVKEYLISMKSAQLNGQICSDFSIKGAKIGVFTELITKIFLKEVKMNELAPMLKVNFSLSDARAKEMAISVAGLRLLIIKDWLDEDIDSYIKSLGGNPADFNKYVEEQKKAVIEEAEFFKKEFAEEEPYVFKPKSAAIPERPLDLKQEKTDSISIFGGELYTILSSSKNDYLIAYNDILLKLLAEDKIFKSEAEKALLNNQEELTGKEFVLDGRQDKGTIANWIKDFIKNEGSGIFDEMVLSKYIVSSANAKKLDENEKKILRKLLVLYRNLKFFPASLNGVPEDQWEIIPAEKEVELKVEKAKEKKTARDFKSQQLRDMAEQFEPGSLERRAVEEEIRKYEEENKA